MLFMPHFIALIVEACLQRIQAVLIKVGDLCIVVLGQC